MLLVCLFLLLSAFLTVTVGRRLQAIPVTLWACAHEVESQQEAWSLVPCLFLQLFLSSLRPKGH